MDSEDDSMRSIKAIVWHDKQNLPPVGTKFSVGVSDVTFGLTAHTCAFNKFSFYSLLTFDHKAYGITTAAIKSEDIETFKFEIQLLLKVYPYLEFERFVMFVDGDRAKFSAIRELLKGAVVILCIYHQNENIKSRFGPEVAKRRSSTNVSTTSNETPIIDQLKSAGKTYVLCCTLCNTEREISDFDSTDLSYAMSFVCSDIDCNCISNGKDLSFYFIKSTFYI